MPGGARRMALALALLAAPSAALMLSQQASRGLEDHRADLRLDHGLATARDSLRLDLRVEWRAGFRDYNRDSRRLYEQARLDGTRRLEGPWRLRWGARQSVFNERRSLRETLASALELGLRRTGPLDLELLGGWLHERRQTGYDGGPRLRAGLAARGDEAGWQWAARGSATTERPGRRHNGLLDASLDALWQGPEGSRDQLVLRARDQGEDAFPDPRREDLERRSARDLTLDNHFQGTLGRQGRLRVDLGGWSREQDRRPRGAEDAAASRGSTRDRGLELKVDPRLELGAWSAALGLAFRRQELDARYGAATPLNRTLSAIALNRLAGELLWRPGGDSVLARAATELRRCDTDFDGLARDPDYLDQARRKGVLRWSRALRPGARLYAEGGLTLGAERHLQASRSRGNFLGRTWRAAAGHRLGLGVWALAGDGALVADYRLYDFDDPLEPRSWIQRRLQWEERWRRELIALPWRAAAEGRGRWMEEDGGSFVKEGALERISDSAREWQLEAALELRPAGGWRLRPGWGWLERRDWRWESAASGRRREPARELRRQGPLCTVARQGQRGSLLLDLRWEWVRDGAPARELRRRNVWARLELDLRLP